MALDLLKYGFIFGLAIVWMIFAAIYDIRRREVPNWLNFSLIGFVLAYRAFYSASFSDWNFLLLGLAGFGFFVLLGNLFYYSRVFAGGDAKLLMGLGAVLPFENLRDFGYLSIWFVILLFAVGAVYSLIWSAFIAIRRRDLFVKRIKKRILTWISAGVYSAIVIVFLIFSFIYPNDFYFGLVISIVLFLCYSLFVYLKAVDSCMAKLFSPSELMEGDWIMNDIKLKGYLVRKTVHGLNAEDIKRLKRDGRKVLIKEGIPFVPAFLIAFLIMVFFLGASELDLLGLISSFLS